MMLNHPIRVKLHAYKKRRIADNDTPRSHPHRTRTRVNFMIYVMLLVISSVPTLLLLLLLLTTRMLPPPMQSRDDDVSVPQSRSHADTGNG